MAQRPKSRKLQFEYFALSKKSLCTSETIDDERRLIKLRNLRNVKTLGRKMTFKESRKFPSSAKLPKEDPDMPNSLINTPFKDFSQKKIVASLKRLDDQGLLKC